MISLLVAIFGKNFLDYRIRMLLLAVGLTVFTIKARKILKAHGEAKQAEQDYKVALALRAEQQHSQAVAATPKKLVPAAVAKEIK